MTSIHTTVDHLDWGRIAAQLDAEGHALLPDLLGKESARQLAQCMRTANDRRDERPHAAMLGGADLRYFGESLPTPLDAWRTALYGHLAVIANRWNETLGIAARHPATLEGFQQLNREAGQARAQSHLSRLVTGAHVPLHQRHDGELVFPLQVVAVLSEPGVAFQGGEFVMTEQRPRMQSRPLVLPLQLGDLAIIATAERPFKGTKGHYRVNLKHAISRVRMGERIGLELSFHDAP